MSLGLLNCASLQTPANGTFPSLTVCEADCCLVLAGKWSRGYFSSPAWLSGKILNLDSKGKTVWTFARLEQSY